MSNKYMEKLEELTTIIEEMKYEYRIREMKENYAAVRKMFELAVLKDEELNRPKRITEYHCGVPVIPKSRIIEAAYKLAKLEDMENEHNKMLQELQGASSRMSHKLQAVYFGKGRMESKTNDHSEEERRGE